MDGASGGNRTLARTWRNVASSARLFAGSVDTQSQIQDFYFGEDLMLRRHDYQVNIAAGFCSCAADFRLRRRKRDSPSNQATSIHARSRSATDSRKADGLNRSKRGAVRVAMSTHTFPLSETGREHALYFLDLALSLAARVRVS